MVNENKEVKNYSFRRAIQSQLNQQPLDGLEREMHEEAVKEMRTANTGKEIEGIGIPNIVFRAASATGISAAAGDKGGMMVPTEKQGIMDALYPYLVLKGLGANYLTGLTGNIDFPKGPAATGTWKTEIADSAEYDPVFSMISMSPKRLPLITSYSKQLLLQSAPDVEAFMLRQLMIAIAQGVESAAIAGAGGGTVPAGITATSGIGAVVGDTNGKAPDWTHIVKLEEAVAIDNADIGSLAYLTNAKVRSKLKQTLKASNVTGYVWADGDNPLNGYKAGVTNLVPSNLVKNASGAVCSAIIFGNFNDLIIGQWGAMDVVVDPYTSKVKGLVEVGINTYWDVAVRYPESFAAMLDALTT